VYLPQPRIISAVSVPEIYITYVNMTFPKISPKISQNWLFQFTSCPNNYLASISIVQKPISHIGSKCPSPTC